MKKIILCFIATFTLPLTSFGQAVLESSYTTNYPQSNDLNCTFYASNGLNYFTYNKVANTITVFNENHIQIKNFILPMDPTYNLREVFFITDHLYNNNDELEFIYSVSGSSGQAVLVCSENGVLLQTFANKYYAHLKKNSTGNYKLIVNDSQFGSTFTQNYDVYSLTGTLSTEQQDIYFRNFTFAFPNPSNGIINISNKLSNNEISTLEIFNIEGKKILEQKIINNNEPIKLDISSFSNGIYIYKLNDETNKFIKN